MQTAKHFVDEDGTLLNRAADELTWMSAADFTPELLAATRAAGTVGQIMLRRFMTDGDAFVMPARADSSTERSSPTPTPPRPRIARGRRQPSQPPLHRPRASPS